MNWIEVMRGFVDWTGPVYEHLKAYSNAIA
jgi:hypothetical protein